MKNKITNIKDYIYFDSHCHTNISPLDKISDVIIKDANEKKIFLCVVGTNIKNSMMAISQQIKYPNVVSSIGIHPCDINKEKYKQQLEDLYAKINQYLRNIVAIGEIGLDYYHNTVDKDIQLYVFEEIIKVAILHSLPVILHIRDAYEDAYKIIYKYHFKLKKILIHCYDANIEWTKKFISLNCYFAIGGKVTYDNNEHLVQALKIIPKNRILVETDSPFLNPFDRKQTNYPSKIIDIVKHINSILGKDITLNLFHNTTRFFGIKH